MRLWNELPEQAEVLAFGAHPDDLEVHAGGTLRKLARSRRVVVIDATEGELSSNGTVETRRRETAKASKILHLAARVNLELPDGGLRQQSDLAALLVEWLRKLRPAIVLSSVTDTRHPDHDALARAALDAVYLCGVKKYRPEWPVCPRPVWHLRYHEVEGRRPDLLVDVSAEIADKRKALAAYATQFERHGRNQTLINSGFLDLIEHRSSDWGLRRGVPHAEPFNCDPPPLVEF